MKTWIALPLGAALAVGITVPVMRSIAPKPIVQTVLPPTPTPAATPAPALPAAPAADIRARSGDDGHSGNFVVSRTATGGAQVRELPRGVSAMQSIGGSFVGGSGGDYEGQAQPTQPNTAEKRALLAYPELGIANSKLNKEFLARAARYRRDKPGFFSAEEWPTILALECLIEQR